MVQLEKYGVLSPVELYEDASAKLNGNVTGESPFITRALETSPKHEVPPHPSQLQKCLVCLCMSFNLQPLSHGYNFKISHRMITFHVRPTVRSSS